MTAQSDPYLNARAERERDTATALRPELADYVSLSTRVLSAVSGIVAAYPGYGTGADSAFVVSVLLARLLNDHWVCVSTAELGYPLQALSLAAGMAELANASAFIGSDDARAKKWLSHTSFDQTYPRIKESIHAACEVLGLDRAAEAREYENYKRLCMPKHSNPVVMSQLGVQITDASTRIHVGPYYDPGVVQATRSAIAAATRSTWLAAMVLVGHLGGEPAEGP